VDLFDPRPSAVRSRHEVVITLTTSTSSWRASPRRHGGTPTAFVGGLGESLGGGARRGSWRLIQESFARSMKRRRRWIDEDAPVRAARYNRAAYWTPKRRPSGSRVRRRGRRAAVPVFLRRRFRFHARRDPATVRRGGHRPRVPSAFISSVSHDDARRGRSPLAVLPDATTCRTTGLCRDASSADALAAELGVASPKFFARLGRGARGRWAKLSPSAAHLQRQLPGRPAGGRHASERREGWRAVCKRRDD